MLKVQTETGTEINIPSELKEITLKKYIEFLQFVEPTKPECLKKVDKAENEEERDKAISEIDSLVIARQIHPYYIRVICYWSGNLENDLQDLDVASLVWLFQYINNLLNNLPEPEYANVIEVNGEFWYLPERYMTDSTVIEYAESAQFQQNMKDLAAGDWLAMAKILCVLVRKQGEKYHSSLLKREKMFLDWNLADVWRVGFFLLKRSELLQLSFQAYTNAQALSRLRQELNN
jgi:hypothetical protein